MKLKKVKGKILAHGESGHVHRATVDVYEDELGIKHFEGSTKVTHEEHKTIELPDDCYLSDRVLEYDHWEEEAKKVVD